MLPPVSAHGVLMPLIFLPMHHKKLQSQLLKFMDQNYSVIGYHDISNLQHKIYPQQQ